MANEITRRKFIKGAAAAAIAVSLSSVLTGCGGQAVNEVKLGAYVVKLYNANTRATSQGTGENTYSVTAKADITFDRNAGNILQELPCTGMFTGKINATPLSTVQPGGKITMSNFIILNKFMGKTTVDVEMTVPDAKTYQKIADGMPVEVTVKINNIEGTLYIVQSGKEFHVVNTDPGTAN